MFNSPNDVAVAGDVVVVADTGNHRVRGIRSGVTWTIAGSGTPGFADGAAGSATFSSPTGVHLAASGEVLVVGPKHGRIRRVRSGVVSTVAGSTSGYKDGPVGQALFAGLFDIDRLDGGRVLVAERKNLAVRALEGGLVKTVVKATVQGCAAGPAGGVIGMGAPQRIAAGQKGAIIVSDQVCHRVWGVRPDGGTYLFAGGGSPGAYMDGPNATASFNLPSGLASGPSGEVYLADCGNGRIRMIHNGITSTVAGDGSDGYLDGQGGKARFYCPIGVALGRDGNLIVADRDNDAIRVVLMGP